MKVKVDEIIENGYNPNSMSELKFNGLVESIKLEGGNRLFPIEVRPRNSEGKYVIIDGAHRFKALKKAGISEAIIEVSDLDEGHTKLRTLSKNKLHGEHDQLKEAELVQELLNIHGVSEDELLSALGIDSEELISIESLAEIDISEIDTDCDTSDFNTEYEKESEIEVENTKKENIITLNLSDFQKQIILETKKYTGTKTLEEAIFVISYYFKLQRAENEVDEDFLKTSLNKFKTELF